MGTISCRKLIVAAAAGLALTLSLTSTHGQTLGSKSLAEPSHIGASPSPSPGADTDPSGAKVRTRDPAEIEADARARIRDRKETMVIETAPRKRSTPSPEFAGSLLDAGLPKISKEKESAKTTDGSNSKPTHKTELGARPKETPSPAPTAAQIEAPTLSLSTVSTPSATASPRQ